MGIGHDGDFLIRSNAGSLIGSGEPGNLVTASLALTAHTTETDRDKCIAAGMGAAPILRCARTLPSLFFASRSLDAAHTKMDNAGMRVR